MTGDRGDGLEGDPRSPPGEDRSRSEVPEDHGNAENDPAPDRTCAEFRLVTIDALEPQEWPGVDPMIRPVGYELQPDAMRPNVWEYDPGEEMPVHHQTEQEELFVVLEGTAEITIGDHETEVSSGDVVWIPPEPWRGIVAQTQCRILAIGAPNTSDDGVFRDDQ